jgi:hypothetical protein
VKKGAAEDLNSEEGSEVFHGSRAFGVAVDGTTPPRRSERERRGMPR